MGEAERAIEASQIAAAGRVVEPLHASSGLLTASFGSVYVAIWREKPTPSSRL